MKHSLTISFPQPSRTGLLESCNYLTELVITHYFHQPSRIEIDFDPEISNCSLTLEWNLAISYKEAVNSLEDVVNMVEELENVQAQYSVKI